MKSGASPRTELLVLQPTPFCNLDCDYCYLPNRSSTVRMSPEVLRRTFERVFESGWVGDELTVVWHAGEPLVLPVRYYEGAISIAEDSRPKETTIHHAFQTNGTRIDSSWIEFFRRNRVRLGVSLDGPAFLHDAHRRTRRGEGTHEGVMEGIRCLKRHAVDFHVITVLTRDSLDHADSLYHFYVANEIHRVGFNVEEIEGVHARSTLNRFGVEAQFRAFLERFLELVERGGELRIRELEQLERFVVGGIPWLERNQENKPLSIVTVDATGNFSTFSPELAGVASAAYDGFRFGNVMTDELGEMLRRDAFKRLSRDIERGIRRCAKTCAFFAVCGGGSPSNKYFETGSFESTETLHCRLTKQVLADVYLTRVEAKLGPNGSARQIR